ncbi:MAG: chloride channel protein, partial [Caulobacteraceae bacterium]
VGLLAGLAALAINLSAHAIQALLFGMGMSNRLSAVGPHSSTRLWWLPLGGLLLGLVSWIWLRQRPKPIVDPVEANALHGGRMSLRDSLFVSLQSVISNGVGASVGLEAAYAQLGAAVASLAGRWFNLRRSDLRTFVGAGAGAGIAAAFGAPITGAFYAFEIVLGSYAVVHIAPVVGAALAGALIARLLIGGGLVIQVAASDSLVPSHYLMFVLLGLICALIGVAIMRLVAATEQIVTRLAMPAWARPAAGGLLLMLLAFAAPQTLSSGHGALAADLGAKLAIGTLVVLVIAKATASVVSLGFGFRGGLFFASLFLGALVGRLFALTLTLVGLRHGIDPLAASLVGMGAMAVAIIGGPFTMTFLVLETTGDFALTAATLAASIAASLAVRETFGYSFSTWRLHLRGETIRSANDVGWLRGLTAGRMMRVDAPTVAADMPLEACRRRYPLGATRRLVAIDSEGRYAGIVRLANVYAEPDRSGAVGDLAMNLQEWLTPTMSIKAIMRAFDDSESDELAVVGEHGEVLGVLAEAYATRRYAEELEKARHDLIGAD